MGPGAVLLDVDAVDAGASAMADARDMVFGGRDSLCRARRCMSRWLQSVIRSVTVAGSVAAVTRSFLSL